MAKPPRNDVNLRTDGPTIERFIATGREAKDYPPRGYAEVESAGLRKYRATGEEPAPYDPSAVTHIRVRSRRAEGFRRAGLKFGADWSVFEIADIGPEKLAAIEAETTMLDSRRISAYEAEQFAEGRFHGDDDAVTKAELRQALRDAVARAEDAEHELDRLRARVSGADVPPKVTGDLVAGQTTPAGR